MREGEWRERERGRAKTIWRKHKRPRKTWPRLRGRESFKLNCSLNFKRSNEERKEKKEWRKFVVGFCCWRSMKRREKCYYCVWKIKTRCVLCVCVWNHGKFLTSLPHSRYLYRQFKERAEKRKDFTTGRERERVRKIEGRRKKVSLWSSLLDYLWLQHKNRQKIGERGSEKKTGKKEQKQSRWRVESRNDWEELPK